MGDQMHPSTRLSSNFRLSEFIKSNTAVRLDIDNTPDDAAITMLQVLAIKVAQPVRDHFNKATTISSGYRCLELNRALRSEDNSQHVLGEAIDLEVSGVDNYELAKWIEENLDYDQLILEFYDGSPASGWVHVSLSSDGKDRKECLTINKGRVRRGIVKGD
jgi:zinc D-Ala-D-Ala carboxypeptidase